MRYRSVTAWVVLFLGLLSHPSIANLSVGDKPSLQLKTIDNAVITSKDMEGKIIILKFWATWCGPCIEQLPHLRQINEKYTRQGVRLISISRDDSRGPVLPFIKKNGMFWTHVIDKEQKVELGPAFGVSGIPHAFILSPEGEVLWRGHPAKLEEPLEKALKEHPPVPSATERREAATQAINHAVKLVDSKQDYAAAFEAVSKLTEETIKDPKVQPRFRQLAMRFKPVGTRAEGLAKYYAENPEVKEKLAAMGVEVDGKPAEKPTAPNAAAAQKLALADKKREAGDDVQAYKLYQDVAKRFAETEQGRAAAERVAAYEADDAFMQKLEGQP